VAAGATGEAESDDLTIIRGIGPVFQKRLNELGIMTFRQLADTKPDMLDAEGINGVGVDLESWIEQARELAEQKND
jgi:predicted flap endonuclease-1-like 5' DNA nuclease